MAHKFFLAVKWPTLGQVGSGGLNRRRAGEERSRENEVNYYPHHIGDYTRDTAHLSMLEDCAYRRLLDIYYATERPLPKSQPELYRLVRARSHAEKLAVDIVIGEFFSETDSGWVNKRASQEILKSKEKTDKARESANMRWHHSGDANAMRTQCEGNAPNNQKPITNNQIKKKHSAVALPEWLPAEAWKDWLEVRTKVKAPNTSRALTLALGELSALRDAGQDPTAVLEKATVKGWKSLYAVNQQPTSIKVDA